MLARIYIGVGRFKDERTDGIASFDTFLLEKVGGFTRFNAVGGWRKDGQDYRENSIVYEIALENADIATAIAVCAKAAFRQEAVLLVLIEAKIEMV